MTLLGVMVANYYISSYLGFVDLCIPQYNLGMELKEESY
jgi:hypothetical protein